MTSGVLRNLEKTARHTVIYAIGTTLRAATALVMLPIYTRYLRPADYGVIELLVATLDFVAIILGYRIAEALLRFYSEETDERRRARMASTCLWAIIAASSLGAAVIYHFADPLAQFVVGSPSYSPALRVFGLALVTIALQAVGNAVLRAQQRPWLYVLAMAATLIVQVSMNVYFVVIRDMGVLGVAYSTLLSGAVVSAGLVAYILASCGAFFSGREARRLYVFTAPLILASLASFASFYGDRAFLRVFSGLAAVGLYGIAFKIVFTARDSILAPFLAGWLAQRFEIHRSGDGVASYQTTFRLVCALLCVLGTTVAVFAEDLLRILAEPAYRSAATVVPLLAAAGILQGLNWYCDFGSLLEGKTRHLAQAAFLAVGVKVAFFVTLIPALGPIGAGLGMTAAHAVELYWIHRMSKRCFDMRLSWKVLFYGMSSGALAVTLAYAVELTIVASVMWHFAIVLGYVIAFVFFPVWSEHERTMAKGISRRLRAAWSR